MGGHTWDVLSEKGRRELSAAGMDKKAFEAFLAWYDAYDVHPNISDTAITKREELLLERITNALLKKSVQQKPKFALV